MRFLCGVGCVSGVKKRKEKERGRRRLGHHELALGVGGEVAGCVCVRVLREDG